MKLNKNNVAEAKKPFSIYYLISVVIFVTCLLISNVAAVKQVNIGFMTLTSGAVLFPITYILNDTLAEVYGYSKAKIAIWLGFAMNIFMVSFFTLIIAMPYPPFFQNQEALVAILGNTPRILVASLTAYLIGSTANAKVLVKIKERSNGKGSLFIRCMVSTLVGEVLDSIIFVGIAFLGVMPTEALIVMIITQTFFKSSYELVAYPLTKLVVRKLKAIENVA